MITDPRFPRASITLPAGVTITGWDNTLKTQIALERLSPDKSDPVSLDTGLGVRESP